MDYTSDAPDYRAWAGDGPAVERIMESGEHNLIAEFRARVNRELQRRVNQGAGPADALAQYEPELIAKAVLKLRTPTRNRAYSSDYVNQEDVGRWLGRTGAFIRLIHMGEIATPIPYPKPDRVLVQKRRSVRLWRRERLSEWENWYREHVMALANAEIAAMEANVRRLRAKEPSGRSES